MMKKKIELTPEIQIQKANAQVEAQQDIFRNMIQEVADASDLRTEAIVELKKEVDSLEAVLARKKKDIEDAMIQNGLDNAYISRISDFIH